MTTRTLDRPAEIGSVSPPRAPGPATDLDLWRVLTLLWQGRRTIACTGAAGLLAGLVYAYALAEPRYAAEASLALDLRAGRITDRDGLVGNVSTETEALNTEIEVIRSRGLLAQVVDALGRSNPPLRIPGARGDDPADAVEALRAAVSPRLRRGTYIFDIRVTTGDPDISRRIADSVAERYILDQVGQKFTATETAVAWLSDRVAALEDELRAQERTLAGLRAGAEGIGPEGLEALNRQLRDTRERAAAARDASQAARARMEAAQSGAAPADLASRWGDNTLARLAQSGDGAAIAARLMDIATRARAEDIRQSRRADTLDAAASRLDADLDQQSAALVGLDQARRETEATRRLYETFLARLKEASVQMGLQQADARILSAARPGTLVAPRRGRVVVLATLLGLVGGTGLVLAIRALRRGYRTAAELEAGTGIPIMGQIPTMSVPGRESLLDVLIDSPPGPAVEAIRSLRTSVLLSDIDAPPRVVMLSSAVPGEGKTTVAVALAHALSGLGKRVLLIEGDVRQRSLGAHLDVTGDGDGLITAMTGERPLEDVVLRDSRMEVDVLLGEVTGVNAADLFSSERFRRFVADMRTRYDMVLIDTPPVLAVPDARVIGQSADAVLLTVAAGRTGRPEIAEAIRQFSMVNLRVTGLVMTRMRGGAASDGAGPYLS